MGMILRKDMVTCNGQNNTKLQEGMEEPFVHDEAGQMCLKMRRDTLLS